MDLWEVVEKGFGIFTEKKGGVTRNMGSSYK